MKRYTVLLIGVCLIAMLVIAPPVFAQNILPTPASETTIDRLQVRCDDTQVTLRRLHTSDSLLRVNIGQIYNGVSARLMARLNSRLALNRIDSTKFVDISAQFDRERATFATLYTDYEMALSALLKASCKDRPIEYYAMLLTARDARVRLAESAQSLNSSLQEYQVAVEELQSSMQVGEPVNAP